MKNSFLLALFGFAVISAVPARATNSFDFTTGSGNLYSNTTPYTLGGINGAAGISVTMYAFGNTGTAGSLAAGQTGQWNGYGLGICNATEGAGCSAPQHQVDNSGQTDFMLFVFSTPVNLGQIQLMQYSNNSGIGPNGATDMDMSYWVGQAGNTAFSSLIAGGGAIPGTTQNNDLCTGTCWSTENIGGTNLATVTDSLGGATNVTYLLVSAGYGATGNPDGTADFFKIQDLQNVTKFTANPEPATFGMFGFALAGLGWVARKRKLS